jgi:hypothetical protein
MVAYVLASATFNRPHVGPEQSHISGHGCWQLARVIGKPHVHGHPPCHGGMGNHHGIPFPSLTADQALQPVVDLLLPMKRQQYSHWAKLSFCLSKPTL